MAAALKKISLTDLAQQSGACFSAAASGDLVQIIDGDQEVYLIGTDLFRFIVDCLIQYEKMITK